MRRNDASACFKVNFCLFEIFLDACNEETTAVSHEY